MRPVLVGLPDVATRTRRTPPSTSAPASATSDTTRHCATLRLR